MELISRQGVIEAIGEIQPLDYNAQSIKMRVLHLPTVDVPKRNVGKWIKHKDRFCWFCSLCNKDNYFAYCWNSDTGEHELQDRFCPNCGADMRGKQDEYSN